MMMKGEKKCTSRAAETALSLSQCDINLMLYFECSIAIVFLLSNAQANTCTKCVFFFVLIYAHSFCVNNSEKTLNKPEEK